jgi:hypothetical protein
LGSYFSSLPLIVTSRPTIRVTCRLLQYLANQQVPMLGSSISCDLAHCDYQLVATGTVQRLRVSLHFPTAVATSSTNRFFIVVLIGYGGDGRVISNVSEIEETIRQAQESVRAGKPFLINAIIAKSDFRAGSISA